MASKRLLKKQIHYLCGDIAGESIVAKALIPGVDAQKIEEVVISAAQLQSTALIRANVSFDKTPRDFANPAEYRKARREYFAKSFKSLRESFNGQVNEIVKEMNSAIPRPKK